MDKVFIIALFGVGAVFLIMLIKRLAPEYALVASICAGCALLLYVISDLGQITAYLSKWTSAGGVESDWLKSVFKVCMISFAGQWGTQLCRDAGENSVADKVETAVKILVLVICLPYIDSLFKLAAEIQ